MRSSPLISIVHGWRFARRIRPGWTRPVPEVDDVGSPSPKPLTSASRSRASAAGPWAGCAPQRSGGRPKRSTRLRERRDEYSPTSAPARPRRGLRGDLPVDAAFTASSEVDEIGDLHGPILSDRAITSALAMRATHRRYPPGVRIAIVGTRGIPAAYGGFETLAWELSTHLAATGPRRDGLLPSRPDGRVDRRAGRRPATLPALPPGQVPGDRQPRHALGARQPAARLRRDVGWQRGQRGVLRNPAPPGHEGGPQRRWHRAPAGEVGARRSRLVCRRRAVRAGLPERDRRRRRRHPRLLHGALRQAVDGHPVRRAAARPGARRPTSRGTGSMRTWSPAASSSTSAASSPRTRPTW